MIFNPILELNSLGLEHLRIKTFAKPPKLEKGRLTD